jgi:hypothetical protein
MWLRALQRWLDAMLSYWWWLAKITLVVVFIFFWLFLDLVVACTRLSFVSWNQTQGVPTFQLARFTYVSTGKVYNAKSNSNRLFISFLIISSRYFGEKKHPPTSSLVGYLNIVVLYSRFLASQDSGNDFVECAQDIEKLLKSEKVYKANFMQMTL